MAEMYTPLLVLTQCFANQKISKQYDPLDWSIGLMDFLWSIGLMDFARIDKFMLRVEDGPNNSDFKANRWHHSLSG